MNHAAAIHVAGADTMIGAAVLRALARNGYHNVVSSLLDCPDYVFVAAGQSGGILANQKYPADLCLDNLRTAVDLIPAARQLGVRKLLYLASSCVYPKDALQPMRPACLWTGALEPTCAPYAAAKLAGIALCQAYRKQYGAPFITAIPGDVFGPGARFNPEDSHVIPSLMAKMYDAKQRGLGHVTLWGSGSPRREFTYADDLADACVLVMQEYDDDMPINIGSGETFTIRELAETVREVVGFQGDIRWDTTRPDGALMKELDISVLRELGWRPSVSLTGGLVKTYHSLLDAIQPAASPR